MRRLLFVIAALGLAATATAGDAPAPDKSGFTLSATRTNWSASTSRGCCRN